MAADVRIIMTGSILHWAADKDPYAMCDLDSGPPFRDPTDAAWASRQYANSKLGLFFVAKKWAAEIPGADIRIVNPGMVATKIFGDSGGMIKRAREWMSMTPEEAATVAHFLYIYWYLVLIDMFL